MKKPGTEIIAAILVLLMSVSALVLALLNQELKIPVLVVFIGTYALISTEKVNRTAMSLLGLAIAGVVLWIGFSMGIAGGVDFEHLIEGVEWTTIIFVIAMSVIVSVSAASGLFQYIALRIAAPSGGDHKALFTTFLVFVAGISLFFDTVSTMLIVAPLTIEICKALEIDFKPFPDSLKNFAWLDGIADGMDFQIIVLQGVCQFPVGAHTHCNYNGFYRQTNLLVSLLGDESILCHALDFCFGQ